MNRSPLFSLRVCALLSVLALSVSLLPPQWLPRWLLQRGYATVDHFLVGFALGVLAAQTLMLFFSPGVAEPFRQRHHPTQSGSREL